ncbi:MAG: DUF3391 domain-containing protein [Proteobacteria bacterium]|nr:DUF3391 domain-containing protein [Pseudomonadota bacterium]
MPIKEVKISIDRLEVGMYVSHLDRPWINTSYLMEGILIQTDEDISKLKKQCSYVYVDLEQGISPNARYWASGNENEMTLNDNNSSIFDNNPANNFEHYRQCIYETTTELEEELKVAKVAFDDIADKTRNVFEDLKNNKKLDIVSLKLGVKSTINSIIRNPSAMTLLVQLRKSDDYSYSRALGTSVWCAQFGRHLGLSKEDITLLSLGGLLLDVGKLELPEKLINNSSKYSQEDLDATKFHVSLGMKMLKKATNVERLLLEMVATHHERADGSGYQLGLINDKIPLFGRIAGIVDSYDAMTSKKLHTSGLFTPHEAMNELYKMRGIQFQAELVEQFIQTVGLYPTGSLVELNTGEVGVITEINDLKRLHPTIMLLLEANKQPYDEFAIVNLSEVEGMKVAKGLESGAYGIKMKELFI